MTVPSWFTISFHSFERARDVRRMLKSSGGAWPYAALYGTMLGAISTYAGSRPCVYVLEFSAIWLAMSGVTRFISGAPSRVPKMLIHWKRGYPAVSEVAI